MADGRGVLGRPLLLPIVATSKFYVRRGLEKCLVFGLQFGNLGHGFWPIGPVGEGVPSIGVKANEIIGGCGHNRYFYIGFRKMIQLETYPPKACCGNQSLLVELEL